MVPRRIFLQKNSTDLTNSRRELLSAGKFMWGFLTEHEVRSETNQAVYEKFIWILPLYGFLRHRIAVENFSSKSKLFEFTLYTPSFLYENSAFQKSNNTQTPTLSLERRWSSRTFRYGYLVTTSPQLSSLPSAAPSLRLGHWLRALMTPMVWRAVCTRPGNVFTAAFWSAITSDSSFI